MGLIMVKIGPYYEELLPLDDLKLYIFTLLTLWQQQLNYEKKYLS